MSPQIYHIIHLVGVLCLFVGIGSFLTTSGTDRPGMKFHGIGLLLLLVAGFGMLHKLHIPIIPATTETAAPAAMIAGDTSGFVVAANFGSILRYWVVIKIAIFLFLGALPVLAKKRALQPGVLVTIAIILGGVAAYLGYFKPS